MWHIDADEYILLLIGLRTLILCLNSEVQTFEAKILYLELYYINLGHSQLIDVNDMRSNFCKKIFPDIGLGDICNCT